ncbi:MAG: S8 family serine peptidase [Thermaerobacter sp.]|jgi:serine protease AprX|nr:S8 family serine peptidase [Thermaerobacter sp.]
MPVLDGLLCRCLASGAGVLPVLVRVDGSPGRTLECAEYLPLVQAFAAVLARDDIEALCRRDDLLGLWLDRPVRAGSARRAKGTPWDSPGEAVATGRGVTVAIIDSGLYPHPDLDGERRIRGFLDLVQGRPEPYDDYGHGTHMAGIIAGSGGPGRRHRGMAPEAALVAVKVLNGQGVGRESNIIRGIQWCVAQREELGIRVLNLSLGGVADLALPADPLGMAAEAAWNAGVVVCTTAGNEGEKGGGTVRSPGIHPSVITVGAVERHSRVAPFSSRGPTPEGHSKPDLVAPGVDVVSLKAPGSFLDREYPANRIGEAYYVQTGTSAATAMVSGTAALLLERAPFLNPDQVKNVLLHTALDLGESACRQGHGLVQPQRALRDVLGFLELGSRPLRLSNPPLTGGDVLVLQERLRQDCPQLRLPRDGVLEAATWEASRTLAARHLHRPGERLEGEFFTLVGSGADQPRFGQRILRRGMRGRDVRVLQNKLNLCGYTGLGPASGQFDVRTAEVLREFQRREGIHPADGMLGFVTYLRLDSRVLLGARDLARGSQGIDVRSLQRILATLGLFGSEPRGCYGTGTERAVRQLQRRWGVTADGISGSATYWKLGECINGASGAGFRREEVET